MSIPTTPNMNLLQPIPGLTAGLDGANDYNSNFTVIDQHNHSPGNGVQITPNGLNINSDLSFNKTSNLTLARSVRFQPQASPISATTPDLGCLYVSGVDLYYNDGNGNQIRVTQSGSVSGAAGTITGLPSGTASVSFVSASGTYVFQQATSTAGNVDLATLILRYPGSYPTPSGNYIALQAPTSLATGYALTLPATLPGTSGAFLTSDTSGIMSYTNVDNSTLAWSSGSIFVKNNGITRAQEAAVGQQISLSCGSFSTGSATPVDVSSLSISITTTGRPVVIALISDGSGTASHIDSTSGQDSFILIIRSGSEIARHILLGSGTAISIPSSSIWHLDTPGAGTYTYKIQAFTNSTVDVNNAKLAVYEL